MGNLSRSPNSSNVGVGTDAEVCAASTSIPLLYGDVDLDGRVKVLAFTKVVDIVPLSGTPMEQPFANLFGPLVQQISGLKLTSVTLIKSRDGCSEDVQPFFDALKGTGIQRKEFDFRSINPDARSNDFVKDSFYVEIEAVITVGIVQEFLGNRSHLFYVISGSKVTEENA